MAEKKLTIRDILKDQLVAIVEKIPTLAPVLTEENIARLIIEGKIDEILRLDKKITAFREVYSKVRGEKKKNALGLKAYPTIKRFNALIDDVKALQERFPKIKEEMTS